MIYLAHNVSFLEKLGVPPRRALHRQHFLFLFHESAGRICVSADRLYRAGPDFARPRQRRAAAVLLPSVSRGLNTCWVRRRCWPFCFRKSPGFPDWFCSSCRRVWRGASWTWNHLWIAGSLILSSLIWIAILVTAGNGAVGMGEVENRRRRVATRRDVLRRGLRAERSTRCCEPSRATFSILLS